MKKVCGTCIFNIDCRAGQSGIDVLCVFDSQWRRDRTEGCIKWKETINKLKVRDRIDMANRLMEQEATERRHSELMRNYQARYNNQVHSGVITMNKEAVILIITTTNVESQSVIKVFTEATGITPKPEMRNDRIYHYLGKINNMLIYLALSEMGTVGLGASQQAVDKGIVSLKPDAVIMVGIAFGIDENNQHIGDVLVSTQLCLYELQRVGKLKISRGDIPHASAKLLNCFKSADLYRDITKFKVSYGLILTGEKLVDDLDYRKQLKEIAPEAIGGEMEGAGVYVACQDHKVDWILVKGICDWANGHKAEDKKDSQVIAAENAATFVLDTLKRTPAIANLSETNNPSMVNKPTASKLTYRQDSIQPSIKQTGKLSFDISNPLLWNVSDERYTATGSEDTFAWSEKVIEGDVTISVDIESNHEKGEGVIIVYGDGIKWSHGCLIFNITSYSQSIRAHTVYEGVQHLRETKKHMEFRNHIFAMKIEIIGDKATLYVDGEKVTSTFLPSDIKKKGRVGLHKYWERPEVTFSNIMIKEKND